MALSAAPASSGIVVLGSRGCVAQHQQSSIPPVKGSPVPKPILQPEESLVSVLSTVSRLKNTCCNFVYWLNLANTLGHIWNPSRAWCMLGVSLALS